MFVRFVFTLGVHEVHKQKAYTSLIIYWTVRVIIKQSFRGVKTMFLENLSKIAIYKLRIVSGL